MGESKQLPPEYDLGAKWDACLDAGIRRVVYSSLAGAFGGLVFFRSPVTRWAAVAFGAGVGIGTAYKECSYKCGDCPMFRVPSTKPPRPASEPLQVEHGQESEG
ncbi:uncharacterized protein LOC116248848 [Nymphaea colorata]|nr:uncharacterized protein LOC116248848 [Nymphaea colorata]